MFESELLPFIYMGVKRRAVVRRLERLVVG